MQTTNLLFGGDFCLVGWFGGGGVVVVFPVPLLASFRSFHFYSLEMLVKSILQFSGSDDKMDQF